jgi:hypothetical protein
LVSTTFFHANRVALYIAAMCLIAFGPLAAGKPAQAASNDGLGFATAATLLRMNNTDLNARLNDIEALGATWIRIDFSWPEIQPKNANTYNWSMYDHIVRVAGVHHLKILAILDYTPEWAQDPRCAQLVITKAAGTKCSPASNTTFARFARTAAIRYKGTSVRGWEIWNEPNISSYWKTVQAHNAVLVDSIAYAALANTAALQIRENDPGTAIITGGLGPMFNPVYPKGISQGDFLSQILPRLNPALFDGIGIHPYSWPVLPSKAAIYNAFYTVDNGPPSYNLRTIMTSAGWGNKQIWGTEFGAPTKGVSAVVVPTATARPDHVSEVLQARIIAQGINDWYAIPNVGPLFINSDSDQYLPQVKNVGSFGLLRGNGTKKPSYDAFQQAAQQLEDKAPK